MNLPVWPYSLRMSITSGPSVPPCRSAGPRSSVPSLNESVALEVGRVHQTFPGYACRWSMQKETWSVGSRLADAVRFATDRSTRTAPPIGAHRPPPLGLRIDAGSGSSRLVIGVEQHRRAAGDPTVNRDSPRAASKNRCDARCRSRAEHALPADRERRILSLLDFAHRTLS